MAIERSKRDPAEEVGRNPVIVCSPELGCEIERKCITSRVVKIRLAILHLAQVLSLMQVAVESNGSSKLLRRPDRSILIRVSLAPYKSGGKGIPLHDGLTESLKTRCIH